MRLQAKRSGTEANVNASCGCIPYRKLAASLEIIQAAGSPSAMATTVSTNPWRSTRRSTVPGRAPDDEVFIVAMANKSE